jgi:hypothetical protein
MRSDAMYSTVRGNDISYTMYLKGERNMKHIIENDRINEFFRMGRRE